MPTLPDMEVSIVVDDVPLEEHDVQEDYEENVVRLWIASEENKAFAVRCCATRDEACIKCEVKVDGKDAEWGFTTTPYVPLGILEGFRVTDHSFAQFVFGRLNLTDDEDAGALDERAIRALGTIEVICKTGSHIEVETEDTAEQPGSSVPRPAGDVRDEQGAAAGRHPSGDEEEENMGGSGEAQAGDDQPVYERLMKAGRDHRVKRGKTMAAAPFMEYCWIADEQPEFRVIFQYNSRDALQARGIISRPESELPSEPVQRPECPADPLQRPEVAAEDLQLPADVVEPPHRPESAAEPAQLPSPPSATSSSTAVQSDNEVPVKHEADITVVQRAADHSSPSASSRSTAAQRQQDVYVKQETDATATRRTPAPRRRQTQLSATASSSSAAMPRNQNGQVKQEPGATATTQGASGVASSSRSDASELEIRIRERELELREIRAERELLALRSQQIENSRRRGRESDPSEVDGRPAQRIKIEQNEQIDAAHIARQTFDLTDD